MNKLEKLHEIFKRENNRSITLMALSRLVNGDLSHIGDAILKGKEIKIYSEFTDEEESASLKCTNFVQSYKYYSIKEPKFYVGDKPLKNPPIKLDEIEIGRAYYYVYFANNVPYGAETMSPEFHMKKGWLVFKTRDHAYEYIQAIRPTCGWKDAPADLTVD